MAQNAHMINNPMDVIQADETTAINRLLSQTVENHKPLLPKPTHLQ